MLRCCHKGEKDGRDKERTRRKGIFTTEAQSSQRGTKGIFGLGGVDVRATCGETSGNPALVAPKRGDLARWPRRSRISYTQIAYLVSLAQRYAEVREGMAFRG
jgi:hypothetical protein